jgi:hypothetical protein
MPFRWSHRLNGSEKHCQVRVVAPRHDTRPEQLCDLENQKSICAQSTSRFCGRPLVRCGRKVHEAPNQLATTPTRQFPHILDREELHVSCGVHSPRLLGQELLCPGTQITGDTGFNWNLHDDES